MRFGSFATSRNALRNLSTRRYVVPDRGYLEISGKDTKKFLQGVCTNDTSKLKKHGDCIAAAFLTPKGRLLADALLYFNEESIEKATVIVETHKSAVAQLSSHLANYKLRSKVKLTQSEKYSTILQNCDEGEINSLISSADQDRAGSAIIVVEDPRISSFGTRYLCLNNTPSSSEIDAGNVITANGTTTIESNGADKIANAEYDQLRLLHGLTEGPEIVNRIPLECNLDLLNYIDFSKGCYVGQELTARTKFKGLVRKRILPFLLRSLHPEHAMTPLTFRAVNSNILPEISSSTLNIKSDKGDNDPTVAIGSISVCNVDPSIQDANTHVGDIIAGSAEGSICCALVRLENVLPKNSDENLSVFNGSFIHRNSDIRESNLSDSPTALTSTVSLVPIRPPFWVDIDPITNNRIDTHGI